MKTLQWQQFFADQSELYGKTVFSVAELANAARTTRHALNTELGRLVKRGLIARYAQGRYGSVKGVEPAHLLPSIDPGAYITGFFALFRHGLVTQAPSEITCFTNRRHHRAASGAPPPWKLRFVAVPPAIYCRPARGVTAPAEQALCDFAHLNLRDEVDPRHLVTFRNLHRLNRGRLKRVLQRYPDRVRSTVQRLLESQ
jgi:hypothetical protein